MIVFGHGRWAGILWMGLTVLFLVLDGAPGTAQERPVPQDTTKTDTVQVPIPPEAVVQDTLPSDSLLPEPDSLVPAPRLPEFPRATSVGFASARWEWTRDELLRYQGLSLLELLEQVPGLVVTRAGGFGRPAGLSTTGLGGARVRVFRDGYELVPLTSATLDLQHLGLVDLESVRVERSPAGLRIELSSFRLDDRRAYSQVEAATGLYQTKMLRALFSRTAGSRSVVTGAYDLSNTRGIGVNEPVAITSGRVRWTYALAEHVGLEAEYRLGGIKREGNVFPEDANRHELTLRGRAVPLPGLSVEALLGRTRRTPADADDAGAGGRSDLYEVGLSSTQGLLRAGYLHDLGYVEAGARFRGGAGAGESLPGLELSARGVVQPISRLALEAEMRSANLGGELASEQSLTARGGPIFGLTLFASASRGARWAGIVRDSFEVRVDSTRTEEGTLSVREDSLAVPRYSAVLGDAGGLRLGGEWLRQGAVLGAAFRTSAGTVVAPLSLAFDRGVPPAQVGPARGVEAYASLPLPIWGRALRVEGHYTRWLELGGRPYLPTEEGRASLVLHGLYFDGQFEPTLRVQGVYRGASFGPEPDRSGFMAVTEGYALANLFLQLRIQDVRAFLLFENFLNRLDAADVRSFPLPGPRLLYGLRWQFRN